MDNRTWYDVLGISRNASFSEIRQRFRELSLKYHPDKQQQAVSQSLESIDTTMAPVFPNGTDFIELMQAWEILSDDAKRARYDAELICFETVQDLPFHDEVQLNEMDFDEDGKVYYLECRCGGEYVLKLQSTSSDASSTWVLPCSTCTLGLKVTGCSQNND
eukprot:gene10677-7807_t